MRSSAPVGAGPGRILVVCLQRIGDVLLCTPLLRSLRQAYPKARIDVLAFRNTTAALEGNPDIDEVIAHPDSGSGGTARMVRRLLRSHDLAVCTQHGDRPHLFATVAAPRRVAVLPPGTDSSFWWKRLLADAWITHNHIGDHVVVQYLRLAASLGIPCISQVVPPRAAAPPPALRAIRGPYAVVHPVPMFSYKAWTDDGWVGLIRWLQSRGLHVVLSGGPAPAERQRIAQIVARAGASGAAALNLAGTLRLGELTYLIEGAECFAGPDTSVTHLAAATGTPTVAVFGPSYPVAWGPWPNGFDAAQGSPWVRTAPLQARGNVWIVQGMTDCVPCLQEGCERHRTSRADCLDQLPTHRVIQAVDQALGQRQLRAASVPA